MERHIDFVAWKTQHSFQFFWNESRFNPIPVKTLFACWFRKTNFKFYSEWISSYNCQKHFDKVNTSSGTHTKQCKDFF